MVCVDYFCLLCNILEELASDALKLMLINSPSSKISLFTSSPSPSPAHSPLLPPHTLIIEPVCNAAVDPNYVE